MESSRPGTSLEKIVNILATIDLPLRRLPKETIPATPRHFPRAQDRRQNGRPQPQPGIRRSASVRDALTTRAVRPLAHPRASTRVAVGAGSGFNTRRASRRRGTRASDAARRFAYERTRRRPASSQQTRIQRLMFEAGSVPASPPSPIPPAPMLRASSSSRPRAKSRSGAAGCLLGFPLCDSPSGRVSSRTSVCAAL